MSETCLDLIDGFKDKYDEFLALGPIKLINDKPQLSECLVYQGIQENSIVLSQVSRLTANQCLNLFCNDAPAREVVLRIYNWLIEAKKQNPEISAEFIAEILQLNPEDLKKIVLMTQEDVTVKVLDENQKRLKDFLNPASLSRQEAQQLALQELTRESLC